MPTNRSHQNNFATNVTSNQVAGVTTTPLNSIPSVAAPFSIALDATNVNGNYEIVEVTSKTATHINHAATSNAHTTAEEVRMVVSATELDEFADAVNGDVAIPGVAGADGWIAVSSTWTYASASTITVPSGAASLYQKGDKVKFTQTTAKYFVISAVTDTTLTFFVSTDYTVANAVISSVYYSHQESPIGFPTIFNFTPTFASSGTQPVLGSSAIAGKFFVKGAVCWYTGKLTVTTGGAWSAGTGTYRFGLPITSSAQAYIGTGTMFDNGTAEYPAMPETTASAAYCTLKQASNGNLCGATTPMTPATGDYYVWTGFFDF